MEKLLGDGADLGPHLARVGRLRAGGLRDHEPRVGLRRLGRDGLRGRLAGRAPEERREGVRHDVGHRTGIEALLLQVVLDRDRPEHVLHDGDERVEDPLAAGRNRREGLLAPQVQGAVELVSRQEAVEVLLVVLEDERDLLGNQSVREEVHLHVLEGGDVLARHRLLRVGDEDDRVGPREHHPARGVVLDLPGNRVELDLEVVAGDGAEAERQEVEEEGPVLRGVQRDEAVGALGVGEPVDLLEVGGLPGLRRPVVDHLRFDGPFAEVELDHSRGGATIA
ncbi:MAG: hypothetical protein U0599_26780 [Vicinamibacteria bacterium]